MVYLQLKNSFKIKKCEFFKSSKPRITTLRCVRDIFFTLFDQYVKPQTKMKQGLHNNITALNLSMFFIDLRDSIIIADYLVNTQALASCLIYQLFQARYLFLTEFYE